MPGIWYINELLFFLWIVKFSHGIPNVIRIAGLFEPDFKGQEIAFMYAVDTVNKRPDILQQTTLKYEIQNSPEDDSFDASRKVCASLREGVAAMFGPMSSSSSTHVQSICDAYNIPHVETRWDFREEDDTRFSINLHPHYITLNHAFIDFMLYLKWTSFTILYEDNESLVRLQEILKTPAIYDFHITALTIEMVTQYYHYMITSLDIGLLNLDDFRHDGCNITAFRLIDNSRPVVADVINEWRVKHVMEGHSPLENERGVRTETALMYDAVHLFSKALHELSHARDIDTSSLSCNKDRTWSNGDSLLNYMKMVELDGLTGKIKFDSFGRRSDFDLELVELTKDGLAQIGTWDTKNRINITKTPLQEMEQVSTNLANTTLVVTTILEDPYMMLRPDPNGVLTGNDRFEGYCVDLVAEIAKLLHFNYTIKLVDDGQYGARDMSSGEWTGMVRELMDKKADLAVASLTISYVREQVIDFSKPFMNLGISILSKSLRKRTRHYSHFSHHYRLRSGFTCLPPTQWSALCYL